MDVARATQEVLLGASVREVAAAYRQDLIDAFGFRPEEVTAETFADETDVFLKRLARHLGDRHTGDWRVGEALREWVMFCDHFDAWDALMTGFQFEGKERLIERGKRLFPRALTAHWSSTG